MKPENRSKNIQNLTEAHANSGLATVQLAQL